MKRLTNGTTQDLINKFGDDIKNGIISEYVYNELKLDFEKYKNQTEITSIGGFAMRQNYLICFFADEHFSDIHIGNISKELGKELYNILKLLAELEFFEYTSRITEYFFAMLICKYNIYQSGHSINRLKCYGSLMGNSTNEYIMFKKSLVKESDLDLCYMEARAAALRVGELDENFIPIERGDEFNLDIIYNHKLIQEFGKKYCALPNFPDY